MFSIICIPVFTVQVSASFCFGLAEVLDLEAGVAVMLLCTVFTAIGFVVHVTLIMIF